jgi:hypothetical protein
MTAYEIFGVVRSDWSSDVCSSDLPLSRFGFKRHHTPSIIAKFEPF